MQKHLYILTGGSRGTDLAIAQQLLRPDHALICISRQANDTLAAQAKQAEASLSQWTQDLSDGASASERLGHWLQQQGPAPWRSATLINNAGAMPPIAPLSQAHPQDLAQTLRVGLEAPRLWSEPHWRRARLT